MICFVDKLYKFGESKKNYIQTKEKSNMYNIPCCCG